LLDRRRSIIILNLLVLITCNGNLYAQLDTLYLKTNERLIGELKEMSKNVAVFETDYSDSDFKITWDKIKSIHTNTQFLISLRTGERHTGKLRSKGELVQILTDSLTVFTTTISDIVFLNKVDKDFWSNFNASLSVGYNFTKANQLSQFSIRSNFSYIAKRWRASTNYNQIFSSQNNVSTTRRIESNLTYNYYFKEKWFVAMEVNWLSNTEQNLDLRTVSKLGVGRFIVNTNKLYWGFQTGLSYNNESFNVNNNMTSNNSLEAYFGTEANLYNTGDLNLLTRLIVYPSLSVSNRIRTDFNFDIKYDLPLDFYIQLGLSLNYDSKPAELASQTDYVFQTTLGWSL
jgi:hypothetical protein